MQNYQANNFPHVLGEMSVKIDNHVVSHLPARVYNVLEDLAETIMNPVNCRTSRITVSLKDNPDFCTPEPVYVYTAVTNPSFDSDSYVERLTPLPFLRVQDIIDLTSLRIDL